MKKSVLKYLSFNTFFNSTDLIELLIQNDRKVISYPFSGYWIDIGNHNDFEKAQVDIKSINLK
jgi:NDP-sugar pyrophosphorylase family protein